MDTVKKIASWLLFLQPVGPVRVPRFFLIAAGIIVLGLLVSVLTGCSSRDFMVATLSSVDRVEEKFDKAFEEQQDTVLLKKAEGADNGTAAVAAIAAGHEFTKGQEANPAGEGGIDWLAIIGSILGINLTGLAGLNMYRNRTRAKDIDAILE